uniref:ATP-dependent RNA helicase n=1 Tax=Trichuris muris TaxID=70415 RepID=A0A5S6QC86_TRIMR
MSMSNGNPVIRNVSQGANVEHGMAETNYNSLNGNAVTLLKCAVTVQQNYEYFSDVPFESLGVKDALIMGLREYPLVKPSKVQEEVCKAIIGQRVKDMIVESSNGSGKTIAFALCMLQKVRPEFSVPQCIWMTPTCELAAQATEAIRKIGKFINGLSVCCAIQDDDAQATVPTIINDHIVVGTSGTLSDWVFKSKRLDLTNVNILVVDEVDMMVDYHSLGCQTFPITDVLQPFCQRWLFSATISQRTETFAVRITAHPFLLRLPDNGNNMRNIPQVYMFCRNDEELLDFTMHACDSLYGQGMMFCATKKSADAMFERMYSLAYSVSVVTSDVSYQDRKKRIRDFRGERFKFLITTNVCSRGIEMPGVDMIINCHVPLLQDGSPDFSSYVHRIGRFGRFSTNKFALTLAVGDEQVAALRSIEARLGTPIRLLHPRDIHNFVAQFCPDDVDY